VSGLGFFGDAPAAHAFCTSSIETLSIWSLQQGQQLKHFQQIRREQPEEDAPAAAAASDGIDFLIGCQWDSAAQQLWLLAGEHSGSVHLLHVNADSLEVVQSLRPSTQGGHNSGVRAFHWGRASLLTGGEDGRLCLWGEAPPQQALVPPSQTLKMPAARTHAPTDTRRRPY